jgi:hypothetical protein
VKPGRAPACRLRSSDCARFAIAAACTDLQLRAAVDQDIGVAQLNDEARTRIDEVGIFRRLRQNADVDLSPPTSRASEPRSGSVATTLSLACARLASEARSG